MPRASVLAAFFLVVFSAVLHSVGNKRSVIKMILLFCTLLLSAFIRAKFHFPWIWVLPAAVTFSFGLVTSVDWLSASSQTTGTTAFRLEGILPLILWAGPVAGGFFLKRWKNIVLAFLPVFASLAYLLLNVPFGTY